MNPDYMPSFLDYSKINFLIWRNIMGTYPSICKQYERPIDEVVHKIRDILQKKEGTQTFDLELNDLLVKEDKLTNNICMV